MKEWFAAAELAEMALPGLPTTRRGIALAAEAQGWRARPRQGRGGGHEYHVASLPLAARAKLSLDTAPAAPAKPTREQLTHEEQWARFERMPEKHRAEARERLATLDAVRQLVLHGTPKVAAMQLVAAQRQVRLSTLYGWEALVKGVPAEHRLPRLAPRWAGAAGPRVECSPEAWDWLRAAFLRPEKPAFSDCYRQLLRIAGREGWSVPAERTLFRRMMALPETTRVFLRDGAEALKRMMPPQQRDHGVFHALQAVNLDDHRMDVFVRWPDGTIARPHLQAVQDIYSGMILAWRIDRSENTQTIRLAIGDVIEQWGIPELFWFDNTRAAANKVITGGAPSRFRFKVKDEDPVGLIGMIGAEVRWTQPYHGQAKPIERAFRDAAQEWAKDLRFAGAYTGNSPDAKPANYGKSAVPLDTLREVIAERVEEHNARPGRRSAVAGGRSFRAVFEESYAEADRRLLIRRASPMQRRLFLLQAETLTIRGATPMLHFAGNRYFAEWMLQMPGARVVARFDADALHDDIHVSDTDGRYLGAAECVEPVGFADAAAAREHARKTKALMRATRDLADLDRGMSLAQAAALLPRIDKAEAAPPPKVVRGLFAGNAALKLAPEAAAPAPTRSDSEVLMLDALRKAHAGRIRRLPDPDED
jgi:putative transposase